MEQLSNKALLEILCYPIILCGQHKYILPGDLFSDYEDHYMPSLSYYHSLGGGGGGKIKKGTHTKNIVFGVFFNFFLIFFFFFFFTFFFQRKRNYLLI